MKESTIGPPKVPDGRAVASSVCRKARSYMLKRPRLPTKCQILVKLPRVWYGRVVISSNCGAIVYDDMRARNKINDEQIVYVMISPSI